MIEMDMLNHDHCRKMIDHDMRKCEKMVDVKIVSPENREKCLGRLWQLQEH